MSAKTKRSPDSVRDKSANAYRRPYLQFETVRLFRTELCFADRLHSIRLWVKRKCFIHFVRLAFNIFRCICRDNVLHRNKTIIHQFFYFVKGFLKIFSDINFSALFSVVNFNKILRSIDRDTPYPVLCRPFAAGVNPNVRRAV